MVNPPLPEPATSREEMTVPSEEYAIEAIIGRDKGNPIIEVALVLR